MSQSVPAFEVSGPVPGGTLPGLVVADTDMAAARALDLGCALFVWRGEGGLDEVLDENGRHHPLQGLAARLVGALVLSAAGAGPIAGFAARWQQATGLALPAPVDLSSLAPGLMPGAAAQAVLGLLAPAFSMLARHNADLLAMLAQLRMAQESLGIALRKRETLLLTQSQSTRWLVQTQGPLATGTETAFLLQPGQRMQQRLRLGSEGLSDLAVFLPAQAMARDGQLRARLVLAESGDLAAEWAVEAEALAAGWLRLSLVRTLSDDLQTVELDLHWQGSGPLWLGAGVRHPDPALCARRDGQPQGRILAHRVWTFMADCPVPLPVDGHCQMLGQDGGPDRLPTPGLLHLDAAHLARAIECDPEDPRLKFHGDLGALNVHPRPGMLSAGRLPRAVPPGIVRITAQIGAPAAICPPIEYALAVVPRHPLRPLPDLVAAAAEAGRLSDWVRREGDAEGDITLILRAPCPQAHDLLLLTRVPPGGDAAYGWSMFRAIRMSA